MRRDAITQIEHVLPALDDEIASGVAGNHRWVLFTAVYREVTLAVQSGIHAGTFDDGPRMSRFDAVFARRYLVALDAYRDGDKMLRSWTKAFRASERDDLTALQHLLLGLNAHINVDLGMSVAEAGITPEAFRDDFARINDILARMMDAVQEALNSVSPLLHTLDKLAGGLDERLGVFVIERARAQAWSAVLLARYLPTARRPMLESVLDAAAAELARRIADPGLPVSAVVHLVRRSENWSVPGIVDVLSGLHRAVAGQAASEQ